MKKPLVLFRKKVLTTLRLSRGLGRPRGIWPTSVAPETDADDLVLVGDDGGVAHVAGGGVDGDGDVPFGLHDVDSFSFLCLLHSPKSTCVRQRADHF
ncbi:MAG: hypothetical protein US12_C0039G0006 [Parcubacteria group bacterium GW2011_GWA2_36_24]|nr:MAG: hypothetical protein US12_C0039G0006 [Parcubacteria group bacterium GW2011_GWA2_36_24]